MIAPATLDALEEIANNLGFTLHRRALVIDIGIDAERAQIATSSGKCRLGSDPKRHDAPVEFEGTPRECAAFLIGWQDRDSQPNGLAAFILEQLNSTRAELCLRDWTMAAMIEDMNDSTTPVEPACPICGRLGNHAWEDLTSDEQLAHKDNAEC